VRRVATPPPPPGPGPGPSAAVRPEGFPADPDYPQLTIASDPHRMLDVFRTHLKPVDGKRYHIAACVPFRFRCRQSTSRCVLQYTLRIAEPSSGRELDQWVTGLVYAKDGEAERVWREMRADDTRAGIPEPWLTFEPIAFIPDLQMVVQVFPYDRKLRNLSRVLAGELRGLETPLLTRLGAGDWRMGEQSLEPTRYRTELGAAIKYTAHAHDARTARATMLRCYLKVYRNDRRGEAGFHRLQSLAKRTGDNAGPYAVVGPLGYWPELRTLAIEEAPGTPLQHLLLRGPDPFTALRAVARAVAAFNQDDLESLQHQSLADQLEDVRLAAQLVQWARPPVRAAVDAITAAMMEGLEDVPPAPIHGDLKADHILLSGDRVVFIDLDSAVLADPVRDPAHLFAYIAGRVGLESVPPAQAREAATVFAEEYFRHVPTSWRERFHLHCAGALVEVASGIFRRQEPRWREKVTEVIDLAQRALSGWST
jgi:phosphotransferase family enzyme